MGPVAEQHALDPGPQHVAVAARQGRHPDGAGAGVPEQEVHGDVGVLRRVEVEGVARRAGGQVVEPITGTEVRRAAVARASAPVREPRPVHAGDEAAHVQVVVAAQQRRVAGHRRGMREDLSVPVDLVEPDVGVAEEGSVGAALHDVGHALRVAGREAQDVARAPGAGQPFSDLGVDRLLHARAGRVQARQPAADVEHLVRPRRVRALAPRRRVAHAARQRAGPAVRAGGAPMVAQRGHRVDRQQRGVDGRLGLPADAVAAVAVVPQVVQALGDRVDEGPVPRLGEAGPGAGGGAGAARRREQAQGGRGERRAGGEARATGHEIAAGEHGGHAPTVGHARAREQPPKGWRGRTEVDDRATQSTATSGPSSVAGSTHWRTPNASVSPTGHTDLPANAE